MLQEAGLVDYPPTLAGTGEDWAATGDLDITADITISASRATIDAPGLGDLTGISWST